MTNLKIYFPLVDGGQMPYDEFDTGKQLIETWITDDWGAPPVSMEMEAQTDDGRTVVISIPYNNSGKAYARIMEKD